MRKYLLLIIAVFISLAKSYGVIAYPYPVKVTQPDGTVVTIRLKGDEHVRWAETADGYSLLRNNKGAWEYAQTDDKGDMVCSGIMARDMNQRSRADNSFLQKTHKKLRFSKSQVGILKQVVRLKSAQTLEAFPKSGTINNLMILIQFTDLEFTKSQTDFEHLMNQVNYNGTGSFRDFYLENSYGNLTINTTVAGVYTAGHEMAYYGTNVDENGDPAEDYRVGDLITEAVQAADDEVNFANFDNDNDGIVDGVYVIYAGYGEEAGAPSDAIWAHASSIDELTLDGKKVSKYACSCELRGSSGTDITAIGVICHEFGHSLGAPDFYDTNYDEEGQFPGNGNWDLMAGGNWNNDGDTPAHHNPYTKIHVYNWATETVISSIQGVTLSDATTNPDFVRINTPTPNEYFLCENRQQNGFNSSLKGHGMLIYHIDEADISAQGNNFNKDAHQGGYIVPAFANTDNGVIEDGDIDVESCPWPGTGNKTIFDDNTTPSMKSWAGANTNLPISYILENSGTISFTETTLCEAIATLPFFEGFDNENIPGCWEQIGHAGNGQYWKFGTTSSDFYTPTLTGNYAYLNSDEYGDNNQNVDLISSTFDFSNYSTVNLEFDHYYKFYDDANDMATLSYSIDNGTTWTPIQQWDDVETANPARFSQNVTQVAGESQVKFKWNYTGYWGNGWAIDNISITGTSDVWTGAQSTDWNTADNWLGNSVPTSTSAVIIPAGLTNYPTLTEQSTGVCKNILIESSATSTGSLIGQEYLTVNGTAIVQQYLTGNAWHLVASPASAAPGEAISDFLAANMNVPVKNISGIDHRGMMDYDEESNDWNTYFTNNQSGNLIAGKGFSLRTNNDSTVTFSGTLSTGTISTTVTRTGDNGWNCVGNPYPSAIAINTKAGASNFIASNYDSETPSNSNLDPSYTSVYVWEQDKGAYTIIPLGDESDAAFYAQVGQAFMVKANTGKTTVQFTPAMQTHQPSAAFKSGTVASPEIRLTTRMDEKESTTRITFNDEMSTGLDVGYDAGVFKTGFDIYTKLVDDNGVDFGIQSLPLTNIESYEIPVGLNVREPGEISFSINRENFQADISPVLTDNQTGEQFAFNGEGDTYTTTASPETNGYGRFTLTFSSVTGVEDLLAKPQTYRAWYSNGQITISGETRGKATAEIYDLQGRKLAAHQLRSTNFNRIEAPQGSSGIYLLRIKDSGRTEVLKVVTAGN